MEVKTEVEVERARFADPESAGHWTLGPSCQGREVGGVVSVLIRVECLKCTVR